MSDCISRQVVLDALNEQIEQCNKALGSFGISPKDEYAIKVERASLKAYKEQLENLPPAQLDFYVTEKIDKAYDDGYNAGYLQGEFDARNEAMPPAPAIPLEWIESYIKTCDLFDLRINVPAGKIIKTMIKIWAQENQGKKRGGEA